MQKYNWKQIIICIILLLALVGLADSAYLSIKEVSDTAVTCGLTLSSCNDVLNSPYAKLFGVIPVAYTGLAFYAGMSVIALLILINRQRLWLPLLGMGALAGFIMSIYFVYIQLGILYTICPYCMLSAINSTLIFILTSILYFSKQNIRA